MKGWYIILYIVCIQPNVINKNACEILKDASKNLKEKRFEEISVGVFITNHNSVQTIVSIQKLYKEIPILLDITKSVRMFRVEECSNLWPAVNSKEILENP